MKKIFGTMLAGVMCVSSVVSVSAAEIEEREAELRPDISIIIDDERTYFRNASGDYIYPILFDDSTYLPLRSIGEIMGKNVNWDEKTKTITISGDRDEYKNTTKPSRESREDIDVQIRKDFKIVIDNKEQRFKDANGDRVYPLLYEGSTYLPLRAIGEIMDNDVIWDGDEKTVTLKDDDRTVTDADSFESGKGKFSLEELKDKILKDAGIGGKKVEYIRVDKDYENGVWTYEIEFAYDGTEYEYEVEIDTGKIISRKTEKEVDDDKDGKYISDNKAKSIAAKDAGIKEKDIRFIKATLDHDDGRAVYEIEFRHNGTEYEYKIDAETGKILDKDVDYDD